MSGANGHMAPSLTAAAIVVLDVMKRCALVAFMVGLIMAIEISRVPTHAKA